MSLVQLRQAVSTAPDPEAVRYPLVKPNAPRLSAYADDLARIEDSHWVSNNGPYNQRLERALTDRVFAGQGDCATVCNATIGLMLALRHAASRTVGKGRLVIMPSFTFAAAAHAVMWAGLVPVFCDIDPDTWAASPTSEDALLDRHGDEVALVFPYATFGVSLDMARYDRLADERGVGVVVDAAASLGSRDLSGRTFGSGSRHLVVYSMHGTKSFGVGEGGIVHGAPVDVAAIRTMSNFGFGAERAATMPGLNAKISEVTALSATIRLADFEEHAIHRHDLAMAYAAQLGGWRIQAQTGRRGAYQTMPTLLPPGYAPRRPEVMSRLDALGVGVGKYFSPHVAQQPYFRETCGSPHLPVTEDVAARVLSLPMSDFMTVEDVAVVCDRLRQACAAVIANQGTSS